MDVVRLTVWWLAGTAKCSKELEVLDKKRLGIEDIR